MTLNPLIGIGLRHPHYKQVLEDSPPVSWFEVHSENFFQSGPPLKILSEIRSSYSISLHGVGLSLGSSEGLDKIHLKRLKSLISHIDPFMVSEHLSWSRIGKNHIPDLLPIPYNEESLAIFCKNINFAQECLKKEILIENPSSYLQFKDSHLQEADFLVRIVKSTGAKILLDINNIYVSCCNHEWDAISYINSIPKNLVKEIHLAGHSVKKIANDQLLRIDTHDSSVCDEVWELYKLAIERFGNTLTLLEWDAQIPPLSFLIEEANKAANYLQPLTMEENEAA